MDYVFITITRSITLLVDYWWTIFLLLSLCRFLGWWTIGGLSFYYYHCVDSSAGGLLVDYVFITITRSITLLVDYWWTIFLLLSLCRFLGWWTIGGLSFYYYHCVDSSAGGLLVDYLFITITVSIPRLVDY